MKLRSKLHMEPYLLNKYYGGSQSQIKSGVRLPGTSGNYISTPDSVLNSVTGDIDIRVCCKLDDWTPAADSALVSKLNTTGSQRSYRLYVAAGGGLNASISLDGTASFNVVSASTASFVDGTAYWVRWTVDVDNGAGSHSSTLYSSTDGITWTQIGTATGGGFMGVGNIFDSTALLELGARQGGTIDNLAGVVYYAEVRNGIDGPVVAKFDSSQVAVSGAQLPATINGWTWNGAALYKRDDYVRLDGTDGNYLSFPDTAANSVTGDIDIRVRLDDDDTTTLTKVLIGKFINGQRSYVLRHHSANAGQLELVTSADGSATSSCVPLVNTPAGAKWVRVTRVAATGLGTFYTSPDGVTWTSYATGSNVAGNIFDGTAPLEIGRDTSNVGRALKGNVYYAEVRNGINGPVVASFNAADNQVQTPWTINGAAWNWEGASFVGKPAIALSLTGATGNYASTPDTAGNSVVGDMDLRAKIAPDSWTPGAVETIIAKYQTSTPLRSFEFRLETPGGLTLLCSADGTNTVGSSSVVLTGVSNGVPKWVRCTRIQSSGVTAFYTSDDGQTWTPVSGGSVVLAATNLFDTTAPIEIGSISAGAARMYAGKVYYAEVRNGIDGPIVAKFDSTNMARTGVRTPASTVQPGGTPNLLTPNQASIETDASGWAVRGNCTIAQDATQFLDGTKSLSLTSVAAGDMSAETLTGTSGVPVVPGKSYTVVGSTRAATTLRQFSVLIQWYNAAGASISTSFAIVPLNNSTSAWTSNFVTAVAPAGAVYAAAGAFIIATGAAAEVHYVDRISLVEAANVWTINGSAWDLVAA